MKRYLSFLLLAFVPFMLIAQTKVKDNMRKGFDEFRESMRKDYQNKRKEMADEHQEFRNRIMKEYIDFVRHAWAEFHKVAPLPVPKEEPLPPLIIPDNIKRLPVDDKPVAIKNILKPISDVPQPQPLVPIEVAPIVDGKRVMFRFYGTDASVCFDVDDKVCLTAIDENAIADALGRMATESYDNVIVDCLGLRKKHSLSDWAYVNMLDALSKKIHGDDLNSATLFMAYVYMQSGYKMRLATYGERLYMLYASMHNIYELPSFVVDDIRYYSLEKLPLRLNICKAAFEKETPLSLIVQGNQLLAFKPATSHHIVSADYPEFYADVAVNENMLDFYKTFPTSMIGENMYTRWAIYANTSTDTKVADKLYPQLKSKLSGLSELEAVNRILNFVQTGFEYRFDDEIWGCDRVFFPDECLHYSYNDCDDRSVLFSRLVRDIVGLDACLVFVPGHVLVGVEFNEDVKGGYVMVNDRKFILCEPTCTNGAPVGWSDIDDGADLNLYLLER